MGSMFGVRISRCFALQNKSKVTGANHINHLYYFIIRFFYSGINYIKYKNLKCIE